MVNSKKLKYSFKNILTYAMQYGVVLGVFWLFKYIFMIVWDVYDHLWYVYNVLNIGTPLIYYVLVNRYRERALGGIMSYKRCLAFSTMLFFFASLIECIIIYIHIGFINPDFLSKQGRIGILILEQLLRIFSEPTQSVNVAKPFHLASNAEYIINNIYVSTLYGFVLSLFYGIFVRRKRPDLN
ncbi:DUF4199 domain-containing protein [Dysgonomonas sp. 520]|uniref:DUF4199 domain-containing protein n=1 Tax=Dysgonomonas sp. 520 TaxID=2302931 RepID=UPI0013D84B70|nr:DUF4199 domain-containing protein [Dysgonomonas sp. 520]NDW08848.1 DUF4199 domain-containing protein [Dysgonomonas sp. 520]